MRRGLFSGRALALAFASATPAFAQSAPAPAPAIQPQAIKRIAPDYYMVTGAGGNVTLWVADHGLILVDDKLAGQANFDNLVGAIRTVSDKQVLAVFNTHHHADHIGNDDRFLDANVMVIANDGLADQLAKQLAHGASPNILYSKDFSLLMMTGRVDAHHYGPGHTGGDTVVYFPTGRIVAAGDLLNATTPTIDYAGGASITGWLHALDAILALDFTLAVPGHGDAPMTRAQVQAFRGKMATFLDRARAAVRKGVPRNGLVAAIPVDDLGWTWNANAWPPARRDGLWTEAGGK
ncbi:MBL fold metallo-hydrolase [Sphingobium aquiterrae]|uniref:MBL fold metallo-hydrolase n=1 Tax=Sphingobium aquiterrae TaxID=2038656 RepID=UPI0030181D6A